MVVYIAVHLFGQPHPVSVVTIFLSLDVPSRTSQIQPSQPRLPGVVNSL